MSEDCSEYLCCQATDKPGGDASDGLRPTSSGRSADAWRPIESAPKTPYEEILVLVETYEEDALTHRIAMWDPENDDWTVFMANWDPEPRYWMPLLPPPGRQDEVARSASDDAHLDGKQPDINEKAALKEALEIIRGLEATLSGVEKDTYYGIHDPYGNEDAGECDCTLCSARSFLRKHGGNYDAA